MDVEGAIEAFEQPVECLESGAVLPAVHILAVDVEGVLAQARDGEARDTGLARARRPAQQDGLGGVAFDDGRECVRGVAHFGVAVNHVPRDEPGQSTRASAIIGLPSDTPST